jgi:hypothetical protein
LSPRVGLSQKTVMAVWPQFSFTAAISGKLRGVLAEMEPWIAAAQKRPARSPGELNVLIDSSVIASSAR